MLATAGMAAYSSVASLRAKGWVPADPAEAVPRVPVRHRPRICQQCTRLAALLDGETAQVLELAQFGESRCSRAIWWQIDGKVGSAFPQAK